jgi:hypothetical protein
MRFGYGDSPYLGCCGLYGHVHEGDNPDLYGCWDELDTWKRYIAWLGDEYPEGWALSCNSTNLQALLPLCPPDVRVSAWVKPFHAYKKGVRPAYSWEPVIWRGGRNPQWGHKHAPPEKGGKATTPKDHLACNITLKKGLTGAKPEAFCEWVLDLLNVHEADEMVDLFPGKGAMLDAIEARRSGRPRPANEADR